MGSTGKIPAGVKSLEIDYDNEESLVAALQGQQFLVICLGVMVPEETSTKLVNAAVKAGVSYVMPNVHGHDMRSSGLKETMFSAGSLKRLKEVEDAGLPWVVITTGFWYEWSLALGVNMYGIDINGKKACLCDDGNTPINTTTWPQCGEAFAALLSLPESGASPSLADWKNKPAFVDSFRTTQRQMLASVQRATGTTDEDWQITYEPAEKRFQDGLAEMQKGDRMGFAKAMYSRGMYNDGSLDYETRMGLDNEKLGLKREDLDEITKKVVEKVQRGWDPRKEW